MSLPLILGDEERKQLTALREYASAHPVDMKRLLERLLDPAFKAAHMAQMGLQSMLIPTGYWVTYTIETGHPVGTCRHMSMSCTLEDRVPSPEAVDMIAEEMGFVGGYRACEVWLEDVYGKPEQKAVNLVQPLTTNVEGSG